MIKFFGPEQDAPVYNEAQQIFTPVGQPCQYCSERIEAGDSGFGIPFLGTETEAAEEIYYHRECFLKALGITLPATERKGKPCL